MRKRLIGIDDSFNEHLDFAPRGFLAKQPRLDDARIVKNKQIRGPKQFGECSKLTVMQLALRVNVQQAAGCACGGRRLRDQFGWELVVKI